VFRIVNITPEANTSNNVQRYECNKAERY